jgi:hypothetical protein
MTTRAGTSTKASATALVAALAVAFSAPAAPAAPLVRGASAASDAPAGARLLACHRAPSLAARSVTVGTWMRPLANGGRMAVKLDLWQRTPGASWTLRSDVPGLGTWMTPSDPLLGTRPGDVYKYRQAIGRLAAPAAYRFRVTFRWLDGGGAVVREALLTTGVCRQPDLRPDLVPVSVSITPAATPGLVAYTVVVGNEGKGPAVRRSSLAATFPGETTPGTHLRSIGRLLSGATTVVMFVGPGCAAGESPAAFAADPANVLDEASEANNELVASCPAP